jgi:hypothetical protein
MAAAGRASHRELLRGDTEDRGQLFDFTGAEASLPVAAVPFGGAHGGGALPAHQLAEPDLAPAVALAQGTDVRADDGALLLRDLAFDASLPLHHAPVVFANRGRMLAAPIGDHDASGIARRASSLLTALRSVWDGTYMPFPGAMNPKVVTRSLRVASSSSADMALACSLKFRSCIG